MFRDSRGVVHTVSAGDPLDDLPAGAARALQAALLRPVGGDLGGAVEQCEAVRELVERWQDAFFAALPEVVDLEEEARWAAEAGLSLTEVEAGYDDDDADDADDDGPLAWHEQQDDDPDGLAAELAGLAMVDPNRPTDPDDPRAALGEELVGVLERELLLLPFRVRLEALVAASELAGQWADLLADHEKLLGHLVLAHARPLREGERAHEVLADRHAALHGDDGPGHPHADPSPYAAEETEAETGAGTDVEAETDTTAETRDGTAVDRSGDAT